MRPAKLLLVRRLELAMPLLQLCVIHFELTRLIPSGYAPALLLVVDRQVDDLGFDAHGIRDPTKCGTFVLAPEAKVEHDVDAQVGSPHSRLYKFAFNPVAMVGALLGPPLCWVVIMKDAHLPVVGG